MPPVVTCYEPSQTSPEIAPPNTCGPKTEAPSILPGVPNFGDYRAPGEYCTSGEQRVIGCGVDLLPSAESLARGEKEGPQTRKIFVPR
jgi:hypothetical protein